MKIFPKALKKSLAKPRTFMLCYFTIVQYCMERNGTVMLKIIDDFVWGPVMLVLLVGTGIFLTFRTRFLTWRNLGYALKSTLSKEARTKSRGEGDVSPFSALTTALAATIGTGNIVGVATAMVSGGPGALVRSTGLRSAPGR